MGKLNKYNLMILLQNISLYQSHYFPKTYRITFIMPMLLFAGFIFGQNTATITVNISNIEMDGSRVFVGLYDDETCFKLKSSAVDSVIVIPKAETVEVPLNDIPFGSYAIAVFQDMNNNGKLDSRGFNIPKEPVGISNYTVERTSLPPMFKKAQFRLGADTVIMIPLISRKVTNKIKSQ